MSRKKETSSTTAGKVFPTRLRELMEEKNENQQVLADALGVQRQTISNYANGQSDPNWEMIIKICTHYKVSADWMLGLTDIQTDNHDVKSICEYTGLPVNVVELLHFYADIYLENNKLENRFLQRFLTSFLDKESINDIVQNLISASSAYAIFNRAKLDDTLAADIEALNTNAMAMLDGSMVFSINPWEAGKFYKYKAIEGTKRNCEAVIDEIVQELWLQRLRGILPDELITQESIEKANEEIMSYAIKQKKDN